MDDPKDPPGRAVSRVGTLPVACQPSDLPVRVSYGLSHLLSTVSLLET